MLKEPADTDDEGAASETVQLVNNGNNMVPTALADSLKAYLPGHTCAKLCTHQCAHSYLRTQPLTMMGSAHHGPSAHLRLHASLVHASPSPTPRRRTLAPPPRMDSATATDQLLLLQEGMQAHQADHGRPSRGPSGQRSLLGGAAIQQLRLWTPASP